MSRDDIERMAREAKGHAYTNRYTPGETAFAFSIDRLEHFVALVAAEKERRMQARVDTLYAMYEQACQHRDQLMDAQRATIAAMRGEPQ